MDLHAMTTSASSSTVAPVTAASARLPLRSQQVTGPSHVAEFLVYGLDGADDGAAGVWRDEIGGDDVSLSMSVYRRAPADASDASARPVIFFFNGGPGASSTPLHLNGFGPMLHVSSDGATHVFADNPDTLLDVADLVFIDPVGTGFNSLPDDHAPGAQWLGVDGDAQAAASAIRAWLQRDGDGRRRVLLCGQSYGAFRVGTILPYLDGVALAGVVLISPMLDASARTPAAGNDLPYIATLPTMAVAARHHRKTVAHADDAHDAMTFYAAVSRFARTDYAAALQWGNQLGEVDPLLSARVAAELARLLGIPQDEIERQALRIDADAFMNTLLADCARRIGSLDTRETGSLAPATDKPTNDPSLVVGRTPGRTEDYFRRFLGVDTGRLYVGLSFDVNRRWRWMSAAAPSFYTSVADRIGAFLRARPDARLVAACGIYDMSTPALATRYALEHVPVAPERMQILDFPAGHTIYDNTDNRAALADAIRGMVRSFEPQ